jgi:hypothetical protein
MNKFCFLVLILVLTLMIVISNNQFDFVQASDNITLITNVVGDNITISLITNVVSSSSHSWGGSGGCCGYGFGDIEQNTPLSWLSLFPNMITNALNPTVNCSDLKISILRVEPTAVIVGTPVEVVFVAESNCGYLGNIDMSVAGRSNKTLGIDLKGVLNKTYSSRVETSSLQPGSQTIIIKGATSSFSVVGGVSPTTIEVPKVIVQAPAEKTEDKIIMWVAIAVGAIILVTIVLLIIFR